MPPIPLHPDTMLFNLYNLMAPALVGLVLVFAVFARGVSCVARRRRDRL